MIIINLIFAAILRIYKIGENYFFTGELGKELLYAKSFVDQKSFPLIGMPTSHEWLNYGPVYYWILIPVMKIFGNSPYILFWISLAVSLLGIAIFYFVFKKIVNKKFALILTAFVSVSPLWVWATRLSKLHVFFFILSPLLIYFLYKIWQKPKIKHFFLLGAVYGLLFSFHFSQIPILAVIVLAFYLKRKEINIKNYLIFLSGLLIPNITLFIYDAGRFLSMFKNLLLWIPYRFAGFSGLYPKNNMTWENLLNTFSAFNEFFGRNLFNNRLLWVLGSLIFIILFLVFILRNRKNFKKDFLVFYVISSTVAQILALFIHTTPPLHYFFPIFVNFGLLFSYFAEKHWNTGKTKILTMLIFVLLFVVGMFEMKNEHVNDKDYVPLSSQVSISDKIIEDSKGSPFKISRIGPYDYFPENYSQNYKYLLTIGGGKIDQNSNMGYTIIEGGRQVFAVKDNEN